ncbi:hypothetical protein D3C87_1719470 [compost metagenome]
MAPDTAIKLVRASSRVFLFKAPATQLIDRLANTANAPEMASPCPARPWLTCRSFAKGVSRLTGMNSEAISANTQSVIA